MDASNFHKGLRSRAEKAEREVADLQRKLSESEKRLAAAEKAIPLAVLEGINVCTAYCMNSARFIETTTGREFADAERAAAWVQSQLSK